ncbi:MAG TPA: hypothetical protein VJU80_05425, partial [Solirubrobacteraceae bacterium]|nr:hypothetical protein [Solirubrobacteraceae bacterium]
MLDNTNARNDGGLDEGRERARKIPENAQPLTDREVPLERTGIPAAIHQWLDDELPESAVRTTELARDVEFWSRIRTETERSRQMKTPEHVKAQIMASLPDATPRIANSWWRRDMVLSPAAVAITA